MNRASTPTLLVALSSLLLALAASPATAGPVAAARAVPALVPAMVAVDDDTSDTSDDTSDDDTTRPTINEFYPEERPLSDCLSSLPKPDCGSEARGGWAQTTTFLAIIAGLAFIAWRIIASSRRARRAAGSAMSPTTTRPGTRDATTVPDGDGGGPAP